MIRKPPPRAVVMALLLAGVGGWIVLFGGNWNVFLTAGPWGWRALAAVAAAAGGLGILLRRTRFQSPKIAGWTSVAAGAIAAVYLLITAAGQHRLFVPYLHDEFSYLIQAHQLAQGRLWMPAHPLGEFFDSFQLLVRPVYASIYFPGTALMHVPGIWLHLPPWVSSLAIAGVVVGLLHRITAELLDPLAAWLAALLLICCPMFRALSLMTMSQLPLLLCGLLAIFAWMRWRKSERIFWVVVVGASLGLAAITRPVDAICFGMPIFIALMVRKHRVKNIGVAVLSALPFLGVQLIANHGITGRWLETPFRFYADRDYPGTSFGFHPYDASLRPASDLLQKQKLYTEITRPLIERHQPQFAGQLAYFRSRLTLSQVAATPFPLLAILLLPALRKVRPDRWIVLAVLPLFVGLYLFYVYFLPHYVITAAPAIILGILIGGEQISTAFPAAKSGLVLFIVILAVLSLPQFDAGMSDEMFDAPLMRSVDSKFAALPRTPAVVLFRYSSTRNVDEEPVYNADVAWPDDAVIIRAHDLGDRNGRIFRYYPDRRFYLFDEADNSLRELGVTRR